MTRRYTRSDNLALAMHIVVGVAFFALLGATLLR